MIELLDILMPLLGLVGAILTSIHMLVKPQ